MLKPAMWAAGVYELRGAQLLQVTKTLELWGVDDGHTQRVEDDVSVNWVVHNLQFTHYIRYDWDCRISTDFLNE